MIGRCDNFCRGEIHTCVHLILLALQSIHKITNRLGINIGLPEFFSLYGIPTSEFEKVLQMVSSVLESLMREYDVTWWDIYLESVIGAERILLVEELGLSEEDLVLDVGCGRGYFTFAAARVARTVIDIDLMNGFGRFGWWKHFLNAVELLGLKRKVWGVAADASQIPFKDSKFDIVAAVHSIRDFSNIEILIAAVKEMKRVVKREGYVVLVENLPIARNTPQMNHLKPRSIRAKIFKNELGYLSEKELLEIVNEVGFKDTEVKKVVDYNFCSTPAIFYIGKQHVRKGVDQSLIKEFREVIQSIKQYGEISPPIIIIKAKK